MPSYQETLSLQNNDSNQVLALCYATMQQLGWNVSWAANEIIVAVTEKKMGKAEMVTATVRGEELLIKSEMTDGRMLDLFGRNKKNVKQFAESFENLRQHFGSDELSQNLPALEALRIKTTELVAQQEKDTEEMNRAMNLSGSNLYVTYALIAINVIVFILMVVDGAGILGEHPLVHIKWGSNFKTLTLSGDWWRLLSCTFIHFGIIHLLMNMYCLYSAGIYLEPMLGKIRYITAYICTGLLASLTSLWWHTDAMNSAGASGAVFGIYGVFLALLTSTLIPAKARQELLKSIGIFVVYNLVFGLKSGVDNAAHIGGLISGFVIGYVYAYAIKKERASAARYAWLVLVVWMATLGGIFMYLQQHVVSKEEGAAFRQELTNALFKDNDRFNDVLNSFDQINQHVHDRLSDTAQDNNQLLNYIEQEGLPGWTAIKARIHQTTEMDISSQSHAKAAKLEQYIMLREEEMNILKNIALSSEPDQLLKALRDNREKANELFAKIVHDGE